MPADGVRASLGFGLYVDNRVGSIRIMAKAVKRKGTAPPRTGNKRVAVKSRKPSRKSKTGDVASATPRGASGQGLSDVSLLEPPVLAASPDVLDRLWTIIDSRKGADPMASHSARLLARGTPQVVQKLGEELVECLIEAMAGNHAGLVTESADVLYHLLITWVNAGIHPEEVWAELTRREQVSHLTEGSAVPLKRQLGDMQAGTTKIP
jgi:phosphoribosyl-ATP pyrophosphohydrolase